MYKCIEYKHLVGLQNKNKYKYRVFKIEFYNIRIDREKMNKNVYHIILSLL